MFVRNTQKFSFCDNRFLVWESTSVKTLESLQGAVPDLLQRIIFRDVDSTQNLNPLTSLELNPNVTKEYNQEYNEIIFYKTRLVLSLKA